MKLQIHNAPIVYLSLSLLILFMGIKNIPREDVMFEILSILIITFILNVLCINGLNKVAWYFVIFFIIMPFFLAIISVMPLLVTMLGKRNSFLFFLFLLGLSVFIVFYIFYFSFIAEGKKSIYTFLLFSSSIFIMISIFIGSIYVASNIK